MIKLDVRIDNSIIEGNFVLEDVNLNELSLLIAHLELVKNNTMERYEEVLNKQTENNG